MTIGECPVSKSHFPSYALNASERRNRAALKAPSEGEIAAKHEEFFHRPLANTLGFFSFSFCEPSLGSTNLSRVSATEENLALIQEQPRGSRRERPLCRVDVRPRLPTHRS